MSTLYILGAGPTGLALAQELAETRPDLRVVMIERGRSLGGLAQTRTWADYGTHDLGPHKIFTLDQELWKRIRALIPADQWLTRPKRSRIYLKGAFLPYPPSPLALARVFGIGAFVRMCYGFGTARFRSPPKGTPTFESDLRSRVGDGLYDILFRPIALKLWGEPTTLDAKLSRGRVQTPSISEVILRLLRIKKTSQFEALEFDYPHGGLSRLWDSIRRRTEATTTYRLGAEISRLEFSDRQITALVVKGEQGEERVPLAAGDYVFSTLPLLRMLKAAQGVPEAISQSANEIVRLNDLVLVFFKLDVPELFSDSWIFVPDSAISFHRVSEQKSFDPAMTPHGTIVCCELMSNPTRPIADRTNDELAALAEKDLRILNGGNFKVMDAKVIRLPASYPVYVTGFAPKLEQVIGHFDRMENFKSIGRAGAFNYIGTLDCMDIGYGAGRWFAQPDAATRAARWTAERVRTSHYPVLD